MKKLVALLILLSPLFAKAQYSANFATDPSALYVYVGTINMGPTDGGNLQKLKIDVFGGTWESDGNGETTFYVANRGGLSVNQTTLGSSNGGAFTLKAYQNGTTTDFYIVSIGGRWKAFSVKSFLLSGVNAATQLVTITSRTTAPPNEIVLNIVPVMYTDASGNLGLNTLTPDPAYRLSVNGKIRAKEIRVESGWADYVFDEKYKLIPLAEVKSYIDKNHHLPEIPSEKEIVENGLNLGEMNKLLMKKVEELTLYLIEKDRKDEERDKLLISLSKQLADSNKLIK